jgi:2-(1,2-epoxy-1,2-dihydrophenyl)acetyl-CoA isomerase
MSEPIGTKPGGTVDLSLNDGVAIVTLNYPERRNAISLEIRALLADRLKELMASAKCRVIVLTGAGGNFSGGGDLSTMKKMTVADARRRVQAIHPSVQFILKGAKPVIAAVEGWAVGAGVSMAAACDIVVAARDARFQLAFSRVNLIPDAAALFTLPLRIGVGRAKMMMLTADRIDAVHAASIGLVDVLAEPGSALDLACEIADRVKRGGPLAQEFTKSILSRMPMSLDQLLAIEADTQALLMATVDFQEGVQSFFEKRPAEFLGR